MHFESCAISHDYQSKRYENIGFKMNNCKRVVMTDIVDRVLMNEVNDRTLGLIQER